MTPTGTSLLGLVKHVASVTLGYFGDCVGRPSGIDLPWDNEESYAESGDMWADGRRVPRGAARPLRAGVGARRRVGPELGLDAPATVPWWPEERRETTLGYLAVHMLAEIAHHAGHADILRESIDGRGGATTTRSATRSGGTPTSRKVQAAADAHRD